MIEQSKELLSRFRKFLQIRNLSPRTIENYVDSMIHIIKWSDKSAEEISLHDGRDFLYYIEIEKKLATSTVKKYIAALKQFYIHIMDKPEFSTLCPLRRGQRVLPEVFSKDEIKQVLSACKTPKDYVIILLGYSCGLRSSEVSRLRVSDIDSNRMKLFIKQSKRNKDRYVVCFRHYSVNRRPSI